MASSLLSSRKEKKEEEEELSVSFADRGGAIDDDVKDQEEEEDGAAAVLADPVVQADGAHFFALSWGDHALFPGSGSGDTAEAAALMAALERGVWRAVRRRAGDWFDAPIATDAAAAACFAQRLSESAATAAVAADSPPPLRWRVCGLLLREGGGGSDAGLFHWVLEPARLKLRLRSGGAKSSPPRKYRCTPMVARGACSPHDPSPAARRSSSPHDPLPAARSPPVFGGATAMNNTQPQHTEAESTLFVPPPPLAVDGAAEDPVEAERYYREYLASVERARRIRLNASRLLLQRFGIQDLAVAEQAHTP